MSNYVTKHWRTTVTGLAIVGYAALHTFLGLSLPGAMDFSAALPLGFGLILASDGAATAVTK